MLSYIPHMKWLCCSGQCKHAVWSLLLHYAATAARLGSGASFYVKMHTLTNVGLFLPRAVFSRGQLYVALSRVGDPNFIKVLLMETREQGQFNGKWYTRNRV